jgi:hypothetical protein
MPGTIANNGRLSNTPHTAYKITVAIRMTLRASAAPAIVFTVTHGGRGVCAARRTSDESALGGTDEVDQLHVKLGVVKARQRMSILRECVS